MGFFDLFKKEKKEEKAEEDIKPPAQSNLEPLDNTTTSVDENASFEIPDFSEEDLDFDLGIEDFLPEEKPIIEDDEKPLSEHNQFRDFFQFEGGQELQSDNKGIGDKDLDINQEIQTFDLPEIETKEELPVFELEKQKSENNTKGSTIFVERHLYADMLDLHSNIKFEIQNQVELMNESKKTSEIEIRIYEDIKEQLDELQHSLLYIDKKLFG